MNDENMKKAMLSLVVPCLNEEEAAPIFYEESKKYIDKMISDGFIDSYEFIYIDDGSTDKTVEVIKSLKEKDASVHFVSFSRNFGKEAAIFAGLNKAKGDFVALMDVDLQDPPSLLPEMIPFLKSGEYDCAATRRTNRKGEPPIRSLFATLFYKIIRGLSGINIEDGARDFRLMNRTMVNAILQVSERNRFSKGIFAWLGFKTKYFEYKNVERSAGVTKWSFTKLFKYSLDGIIAFSTKPLAMASFFGIAAMLIAFGFIVFIIVRKLIFGDPTPGWASMVCILLLCSGMQLFCTGILGQYLAKTYIEAKDRPLYIIRNEE